MAEKVLSTLFSHSGIEMSESELADIVVNDRSFCREVLMKGSVGLGDSYIEGKWDSPHIDEVIHRLLSSGIYQKLAPVYGFAGNVRRRIMNLQNKKGARQVIEGHYDLPIETYEAFLDPYFQYTCARFEGTDDLDQAQVIKMDNICQKLNLKPGERVMDLGGGWGGLTRFMAERYGVNSTVVTLSGVQAKHIRQKHGDAVKVLECDYREIPDALKEGFDAVSVVGMMEHVGLKNYREFMGILHQNLKKDGRLLLHTLYTPYSLPAQNPWVDKHIFPNGELTPKKVIENELRKFFVPADDPSYPVFEELTPYYPPTLRAWKERLCAAKESGRINMSEPELRKWIFYLMSYAGAIEARHVRVGQFLYKKAPVV